MRCWVTAAGGRRRPGTGGWILFSVFLLQVKRSRSKGGFAGPDGTKSVFGQMCAKMSSFGPDSLLLPHRVWKVKFVGESACRQGREPGRRGLGRPPGCSHSSPG